MPESPRILLVRHGRSAIQHDGSWMTCDGVATYEEQYNAAGIRDDDHPPPELLDAAKTAKTLVASDMIRAIESVKRLAADREPEIQPLIREIYLEPPRWIPTRLPIEIWDAFSAAQWTARLAFGSDHELVRRADVAAEWLIDRVGTAGTLLAITHGGFRRILTRRLELRGWRCEDRSQGFRNWSAWRLAPSNIARERAGR